MVPRHGCVLLTVTLCPWHLAELLREGLLILVFLHILQIPLNLRLELIEWIEHGLVFCGALLVRGSCRAECVISVHLFEVDLHVPQVVLEPVWRRLLQINAHVLQGAPVEFRELI